MAIGLPFQIRVPNRGVLVAMIVIGALVFLLVRWWWVQPNEEWACGAGDVTSGCVSSVQLDVTEQTLGARGSVEEGDVMWRMGSDISNDGRQIAAVLHTYSADQPDPAASSLVLFDAQTGARQKTLLDLRHPEEPSASRKQLEVSTARFSPDSSQIVVAAWPSLFIFDVGTGKQLTQFRVAGEVEITEDGRRNVPESCIGYFNDRIALSDDHQSIQCNGQLWEADSGELLNEELSRDDWLTSRFNRVSDDGSVCAEYEEAYFVVSCSSSPRTKTEEQLRSEASYEHQGEIYSFDPTSRFVFTGNRNPDRRWWQPRRLSPPSTFSVVDFSTGKSVATIPTDFYHAGILRPHEWSEKGDYLMIYNEDGLVTIHSTSKGKG